MKEIVQGVTKKDEEEDDQRPPTLGTSVTGLTSRVMYRACEDRERSRKIVKEALSAANING